MSKFINKVQDLAQKAKAVKQTIEQMPPKIEEFRQTVTTSAAQLQQMRADVQASVSGLGIDNEGRLIDSIREINEGSDIFKKAGYELVRAEMELAPGRQLSVHFDKFEEVSKETIQQLLNFNQHRRTIHSILTAFLRAQEMESKVEFNNLSYRTLVVHVGLVPTVRMRWELPDEAEVLPNSDEKMPQQITQPAPTTSSLGQIGTFFEKRAVQPPKATITETQTPGIAPESTPPIAPTPSVTAPSNKDWKQSALDRFKKMPDLRKAKP